HPPGLLFIPLAPQSPAAPRNFFPNEDTKAVTRFKYNARLLIMSQPDEINAHLFHHPHFPPDHVFRHGRSHTRMVLVPMRPPQQQSLSIQVKRSLFREFNMTETDSLRMPRRIAIR